MNNVSRKNGFVTLIGLFFFVFLFVLVYCGILQRMKEQSDVAFKDALEKEFVQRGSEVNLKYSVNRKSPLPSNKKIVVSMTDELGTKEYLIDPEKNAMNVTTDPDLRMYHTVLFKERPLHPDILNNNWQRALQSKGINAKTGLNIVVMDRNHNNHQKLSKDGFMCVPNFHLFTLYIGYMCEIEVSSFIHYSMLNILIDNWLSFFLLFLGVMATTSLTLFLLIKKEKTEKEDVLLLSNASIPTVEDSHPRIYIISPDTLFDSVTQQLTFKGENEAKLSEQLSALLILFMEAENYEMTDETIINKLWPDNSGNPDRLYSAMKRLRKELKLDPSVLITHIHPNKYKLTIS